MGGTKKAVIAAAVLFLCPVAGCSGTSGPGGGTVVAGLTGSGQTVGVSLDGSDVYVVLTDDGSGPTHIAVARVRDSKVTDMPLATTDWSDYEMSDIVGLNPTQTVRVSGGKAYFLGFFGVTVVPLDGTASRILYPPPTPDLPTLPHGYNALGAFAVDNGDVYVCFEDTHSLGTASGSTEHQQLARFRDDGTWEVLSSSALGEDCFAGAVTSDASAVYWSTDRAIRSWNKTTGAVTTLVDFGGTRGHAPSLLAVSGDSVAWFDETAKLYAASKSSATRVDAAITLFAFQPTDLAPFSLTGTSDHVFWLSMGELRRVPTAGGAADLLARRDSPPGRFMGLAARESTLFFSDANAGTPSSNVLRSVP